MDGRKPTGILYVNTHVDDPAKEIEYDRWYHDVHFPDVTEPGIFVDATMFHNVNVPPAEGEGKFLAFYETYWKDVEAATSAFKDHVDVLVRENRIHAGTVGRSFGIYEQLRIVFSTDRRKRSQSVLAVHIDCTDDSKADELREWYTAKHVPEVVALGIYHTGSFNELVRTDAFAEPTANQPRFLALYESDIGDPSFLASQLVKAFPDVLPDYVQYRYASNFYRASP
jgi:hypothetical protein